MKTHNYQTAPKKSTLYKVHLFVCVNDRGGTRKSCADGNSKQIRALLKQEIKKKGWEKEVRVSQSLCMGLCGTGPNVVIYPQQILFTEVSMDDIPGMMNEIEKILHGSIP